MEKKKIIILGSGISGLSCGYYLSHLKQQSEFIILEKADRPGGWMQTEQFDDFLFEKGPRTFHTKRSLDLLDLACSLNLQDKLIPSDESASKRYLWVSEKLQKFPWPLFSFSMVGSFLKEWFTSAKLDEEETIHEFAARRFSPKVAERFFDPMAIGVYAGDIRKLSINSAFPFFKMLEKKYGSVTKGLLKEQLKKKELRLPISSTLFSFEGGVQTLISALQKKMEDQIHYKETVTHFCFRGKKVEVQTTSGLLEADAIVTSLDPLTLGTMFKSIDSEIAELLSSIKMQGLVTVQLGYHQNVLPLKGFGYLVPSSEKAEIYGAIFDSKVFPQHNRNRDQTRITVMMKANRYSEDENIRIVKGELRKHLKIVAEPGFARAIHLENAIPQFEIGHQKKIAHLKELMQERYPGCRLLGNYLNGASVNDCVANSKLLALNLQQELLSNLSSV